MGSLNSSSVTVVSKSNVSTRQIGRSITKTEGLIPNVEEAAILTPPLSARSSGELGTQVDEDVAQRSTLGLLNQTKVAQSTNDSLVNRAIGNVAPDATSQPEINNKPVSQRYATNSGGRIIVRDSDADTLISREENLV